MIFLRVRSRVATCAAVIAALTGLALTGALCACGSAAQHSGPAGAGAGTTSSATAPAGDFIHVPAWLPHMEINPSKDHRFVWVVVRSTAEPIVVNLPGNYWK